MVDDIEDIQTCGVNYIKSNTIVNSFIESKKLTFGTKKCKLIHCGKNVGKCNELNVHEKVMERSSVERYLGDYINQNAKLSSTISHRWAKGYAIVSDILSILRDIPSKKRRVQIGLQLRNTWFRNSILLNSEVWHNILVKDIEELTKVDQYLMRKIL